MYDFIGFDFFLFFLTASLFENDIECFIELKKSGFSGLPIKQVEGSISCLRK